MKQKNFLERMFKLIDSERFVSVTQHQLYYIYGIPTNTKDTFVE